MRTPRAGPRRTGGARIGLALAVLWVLAIPGSRGPAAPHADAEATEEARPGDARPGSLVRHADALDAPLVESAGPVGAWESGGAGRGRPSPRPSAGRDPSSTWLQRARTSAFRAAGRRRLDFGARLALAHAGLLVWHATAPPPPLA